MFRFESPIYLWLLLLIPLLSIFYYILYQHRKQRIKKFGDIELVKQLSPALSNRRRFIKFLLMQSSIALMVLIIARPQIGNRIATTKNGKGIETVIALDISNSMLAQDVIPSRLDKSKLLIEDLLRSFDNDKVGLIVFAGDAFVQLPITSDFISAKMFLNDINPSLIGTQGTDIGKAINLAMHSFSPTSKAGKAIIIITDGEDNEGGAEAMAKKAQEAGFHIYILGIGSTSGAEIPIGNGEKLKDKRGNIVVSHLNENMCKGIADAGKGIYIHVDNNSDAQQILKKQLSKLQKDDINNIVYSDYDEQFQAIAIILIILIIGEVCILERKNTKKKKWYMIKNKFAKLLICIFFLSFFCNFMIYAQSENQLIRKGNKFFRSKNYLESEIAFRKSLIKNNKSDINIYNLGCALQAQKKNKEALSEYKKATKVSENSLHKSKAYYNIGTIFQGQKKYDEAIESYKDALRNNPNNNNARYNLELCKQQQKRQQQKRQQQQKSKNKKNNSKQQNKNKKNKNNSNKRDQKRDKEMSKDNAERLLDAAMQQEKLTQKRLSKAMHQPSDHQLNKNW